MSRSFTFQKGTGLIEPEDFGGGQKVAEDFDILLQDAQSSDVEEIASALGVDHLGPPKVDAKFPLQGIVYLGRLETNHVWFPVQISTEFQSHPVKLLEKSARRVDVVMLSATGSPKTYLCRKTFTALGWGKTADFTKGGVNVKIQGKAHTVHLSHGMFEDVDLLGQDFLRAKGLQLTVRMASLTATLDYEE